MPRLPEALIQQIKQDVDLVQLIQSQGYALKKNGKDYLLSCPWHDDKEPSLVVSPDTNLWHCMGACQTGGSVIDWVMKTQGVSFRLACEILQKEQGLVSGTQPVKRNTTKKLSSPIAAHPDNQKLLNQVIDYYHHTLKESPEALEYLEKRGLNHPELMDTFKLGYANRTLCYRLPDRNRKAGAEIREQLQAIGLLRTTGHEHFSGSIVVPTLNEQGEIQEVYGRKILGKRLRKGTAQHLYLPGSHAGVWNITALSAYDEVILCEALIDAMTFWVHGFKNVTSSYGALGFTDDHLAAFIQHGIQRVLIAYDRDGAGDAAAEQLAEKLTQEGIECFRILLPKGMDVNEYALKMSPAVKSLELIIRKAQWMGRGKDEVEVSIPLVNTVPVAESGAGAAKRENVSPHSATAPCVALGSGSQLRSTSPVPGVVPPASMQSLAAVAAPATPGPSASPVPRAVADLEAHMTEHEIQITLGERSYRIRGLSEQFGNLKINLMLNQDEAFHSDKLDLYSAKQRTVFMHQAGEELGVKPEIIKKDLGKLLLKLEAIQQDKQRQGQEQDKPEPLSSQEQTEALALLQDKDLMARIQQDFISLGVVGEASNTLVGYLGCVSRKLDKPLAVMIQSSSAAGKSSLMEAILALMPESERVQYSAMTGQSLFYLGETSLSHKILAISEEEGASNASYALKLLQSEGEVTIASTGKDAESGQLVTQKYTVKGPTMLMMTTTAIDIDEELMNRCLVLSVNESRAQTQAIHQLQRNRRTLAGLQETLEKERVIRLHQHAQRLLRPLRVVNPYADQLTFLSDKTRTRRDHEKYLTLIDCIALLHQYQRDVKALEYQGQSLAYIEVTPSDIALANQLAHEVLGRTLDELPPQTRKLLTLIQQMVKAGCESQQIDRCDYRFSRRDIREYTGWGNTQLKVHCHRLEELEYLLVHRGGRGQSFEYELLYDGSAAHESHMMGLIDVETLVSDAEKSGVKANRSDLKDNQSAERSDSSGASRAEVGAVSVSGKALKANQDKASGESGRDKPESEQAPQKRNGASYHSDTFTPFAQATGLDSESVAHV